jgi:UDP-N-acetylglucosamine 2-epimerase (non-hydrolysing)/GDP/UDP-N,N'-diacetylbacillosamine 2-epimerase (hydrolysing)
MRRKICVITGSRADYGIFFPILKAIKSSNSLRLYIIATCVHLMKEFGYTVKDIKKDGFNIYEKVHISYRKDTGQAMADSVGRAVSKFSKTFSRLRPDLVVILGDRGEMLAAGIAANYVNIPVAHIHGGEVSGHVDEVMRHAITKISHIHFTSTENAKKRILKLGEEPDKVFVVGAPALDCILNGQLTDKDSLFKRYGLTKKQPLLILIQHPVLAQIDEAEKQIRITLDAIKRFKLQTVVIYPNSDAGGRRMIKVIREYKKLPFIKSFDSLPHEDYLGLMKVASVLIGNSSSGIIEAPSFMLPVVNIGIRQQGRERGINVIDVAHDEKAIIDAIKRCLYDTRFKERIKRSKNPYGDGHASERLVKMLSGIVLDKNLLQKKITY